MRNLSIKTLIKTILTIMLLTTSPGSLANECMSMPFQSKYLAFLNCLGTNTDPFSLHQRSIALSFIGKGRESQMVFDNEKAANAPQAEKLSQNSFNKFNAVNAVAEITQLAKSRRVVMLNEAHHVSQHRVFALELATALNRAGYKYLAVEAIGNATKTSEKGYVVGSDFSSGYYTRDPEFANFLRGALALGFKLVTYEARDNSDGFERESKQALNLIDFTTSHPDAKVFVYAGFGHIRKNITERYDYMAKIFREKSGIDPLSVDQEGGTWNPHVVLTDSVRQTLGDRVHSDSVVFKDSKNNYLTSQSYSGQVDLTVFHPREELVHGRPNWLSKGRQPHVVNADKFAHQRPIVLRAMLINEMDGVPVDQVLIETPDDEPYLFLPPGEYDIQIETLLDGVQSLYKTKIGGGIVK